MNENTSALIIEAIQNTTIVYEKEPIKASEFNTWLEQKHPGKNLSYWTKMKEDIFASLRESGGSYNDLPEPELSNFFESVKISSCFNQLVKSVEFLTQSPFFIYYIECENPDFLSAKKALTEHLPMLIKKSKSENHLLFKKTFFGIPEIKKYFESFVFNMKNKHSGKYELVIGKKIHFPTSIESIENGTIFRFMDCVDEAFSKSIFDENNNIVNSDEIIRSIFLPQIWNGCGYCNDTNLMTLNHKNGTVDEIHIEQCPLAKRDTTKQISQITTNGKLIFCNDVRDISQEQNIEKQISKWGLDNETSTYINTWDGQQGFMKAYAELFNVGYIQAGNHGACLKKDKNGLKVTYGKGNSAGLSYISLTVWSVCFIDYDKAITLAGSEQNLLKKLHSIEYHIVDVKPGTYEVMTDCNMNEEKAYESKRDVAFGKLTWIHN